MKARVVVGGRRCGEKGIEKSQRERGLDVKGMLLLQGRDKGEGEVEPRKGTMSLIMS